MELILWRHAEAEDGFPDLARALTPKGHKQAKQMAAWLHARLPANTRVLVSPAMRTQQTAAALRVDFTTHPELAPGATPQHLLQLAGWPHNDDSVIIVGHQPTLGELAAQLLCGNSAGCSIKKGAVWWLSSRGAASCQLRAVMAPDLA